MSPPVVLIGLANPRSPDPADALLPRPPGTAGHRLWKSMHDVDERMTQGAYCRTFRRYNLATHPPPSAVSNQRRLARQLIPLIVRDTGKEEAVVACLGRVVADAFAHVLRIELERELEPVEAFVLEHGVSWSVAYFPHPSGSCRWFNDEQNKRLAADWLLRRVMA